MINIYDYKEFTEQGIGIPDFYFSPQYGKLCEISERGIWKCIIFNNGEILMPFIQRSLVINEKNIVHLVSNYGYGGIYVRNNKNISNFFKELEQLISTKKYITHFLRFTPYFTINSIDNFKVFTGTELIFKSKTFGIKFSNDSYENYIKKTKKNHRRSLKKSKDKLNFIMRKFVKSDISGSFQKIYKETMDRVNSNKYYYFSEKYYKTLYNCCQDNVFIVEVSMKETNEVIASAIIFHWEKKYLHYHLGCPKTEYLKYCPNNFLHDNIIKFGFENNYELYHLGGGLINNDPLHKFKESFSNISFDYYQAKIIYNLEEYNKLSNEVKKYNKNYFPKYING